MRVTETQDQPRVLPSRCEHKAVRGLRCVCFVSVWDWMAICCELLLVYKQRRCIFYTSRGQEVQC